MKLYQKLVLPLSVALLMLLTPCEAKVISGSALLAVDAKQAKADMEEIALAFAKREALESAAVYINSLTQTHSGVVNRDEVSTFVKGIAKLKPGSVKKKYEKSNDGTQILHLKADFDIDEKEVEAMIARYQYDENVIWKYQRDVERFNSLLLKYEYLLRKQRRVEDHKNVDVLSKQEKNEIIEKLNTRVWPKVSEVCTLCVKYLQNGRYKEAIAVADLLILHEKQWIAEFGNADQYINEATGKTYAWRAQALYALERYEEANHDIDQSLRYYPNNYLPLLLKVEYLTYHGEEDKTLPYVQKMAVVDPVAGNGELAQLYAKRGEFSLAHQAIDKSIAEESNQQSENHLIRLAVNYSIKAEIFEKERNFQEALNCYSKGISICPSYGMTYFNRGVLYEKLQKGPEALADFSKAIELLEDLPLPLDLQHYQTRYLAKAYYNRAVMHSHLEHWRECLQDVNKAIELFPDGGNFYALRRKAESKLKAG